jgi:hypothetical protein
MGMLDGLFKLGGDILGAVPGVGGFLKEGVGALTGAYDTQQAADAQAHMEGRQDNAIQRRVADLRAAGLAPQLAGGGADSSSQGIRVDQAGGESTAGFDPQAYEDRKAEMAARLMSQKAQIGQSAAETSRVAEDARARRIQNDADERVMYNPDGSPLVDSDGLQMSVAAYKSLLDLHEKEVAIARGNAQAALANAREDYSRKMASLSSQKLTDLQYRTEVDRIESEYRKAAQPFEKAWLGPHSIGGTVAGAIAGAAGDLLKGAAGALMVP